jgi:hypothetical protein
LGILRDGVDHGAHSFRDEADLEELRRCLEIPDMVNQKKKFKCTGAFALRVFLFRIATAGTWPAKAQQLCGRHPSQLSRIFHWTSSHMCGKFQGVLALSKGTPRT